MRAIDRQRDAIVAPRCPLGGLQGACRPRVGHRGADAPFGTARGNVCRSVDDPAPPPPRSPSTGTSRTMPPTPRAGSGLRADHVGPRCSVPAAACKVRERNGAARYAAEKGRKPSRGGVRFCAARVAMCEATREVSYPHPSSLAMPKGSSPIHWGSSRSDAHLDQCLSCQALDLSLKVRREYCESARRYWGFCTLDFYNGPQKRRRFHRGD